MKGILQSHYQVLARGRLDVPTAFVFLHLQPVNDGV